ncbi:Flp family type IVb pilin [Rhodalgimonas zhirmunskyi]|uniref:Pilus assembly protein n=1 Tax=Rhodalgimonas zhirmunskyi TaxID=2964767 RepID=A0AAJ1X6S1_9RHOB|nr:hypothetical protein [Rhodoalgimonas zhirmunskyi]MDQ2093772.1 hypothetical protein [Rhodoalgimonas zhirmunskyi]
MKKRFDAFIRDEDGAVTVDWVVLTAFVVTLMGLGYGALETSTTDLSSRTGTYISSQTPN